MAFRESTDSDPVSDIRTEKACDVGSYLHTVLYGRAVGPMPIRTTRMVKPATLETIWTIALTR